MLAFPHSWHASKHGGDERGQIGQDEHELSPCKLARESRIIVLSHDLVIIDLQGLYE